MYSNSLNNHKEAYLCAFLSQMCQIFLQLYLVYASYCNKEICEYRLLQAKMKTLKLNMQEPVLTIKIKSL